MSKTQSKQIAQYKRMGYTPEQTLAALRWDGLCKRLSDAEILAAAK